MKKFILYTLLLTFCCTVFNSYAQQTDEFEKLKKLYIERKYEACLMKSEKYIYNEKTKREPIPYLYLSKSYYELSLSEDPDIQEYYTKALKNAIKYAIKFVQKDKKGIYTNMSTEFFNKLIKSYLETIQEEYESGKYIKASANFKQLLKLKEDNHVLFAKGICNSMNNNPAEANKDITLALKNLKSNAGVNSILNSEIIFINYGIDYTDYLIRNEKVDSALSTINTLLIIKPGNNSLKMQKSKILEVIPDNDEEELKD